MKLDATFIRLPYRFDPKPVLEQVCKLDEKAWQPHPLGWDGHVAFLSLLCRRSR